MNSNLQEKYLAILQEELVPAMGCTEPIALAYASAKAREILGCEPEYIVAKCSGNMIKNVRCVTIPNSGGMTGIETACILGAIAGHSENKMEVLEKVTEEQRAQTKKLLEQKTFCLPAARFTEHTLRYTNNIQIRKERFPSIFYQK